MSYYSSNEMKAILDKEPKFREKLYCRGFLITNDDLNIGDYPFYDNWKKLTISDSDYKIYYHQKVNAFIYKSEKATHFLIGHAYNPFTMDYQEEVILNKLSDKLFISEEKYLSYLNMLTGVFCVGFFDYSTKSITISTDCTGMQLTFICKNKTSLYISSHSKLIGDLCGFNQDDYIVRLVNSKYYHYWGTWLPADLSPYKEIKKVQPNFTYRYNNEKIIKKRYFPTKKIEEVSEKEYPQLIHDIARIMRNNMLLIAKKWPKGKAAISVTGGKDSATTLASAKNCYDSFKYFSYISNGNEIIDAEAAHKICNKVGLDHKIYFIPNDDADYKDIEIYRMILECNSGCIGHNNPNDVRKRLYFDQIDDFEIEVKSWVNELGRGEAQNKYGTTIWPKKPTPGYYRCMWKVILDYRLIKESNQIFKKYINEYYNPEVLSYLPWMDYFYWEFSWSGGEGTFLTAEHKYSYDITIPYNNRRLIEMMFRVPLKYRLKNRIPLDLIRINNDKIGKTGVSVKNAAHTNMWTTIIRSYLKIFSKI